MKIGLINVGALDYYNVGCGFDLQPKTSTLKPELDFKNMRRLGPLLIKDVRRTENLCGNGARARSRMNPDGAQVLTSNLV